MNNSIKGLTNRVEVYVINNFGSRDWYIDKINNSKYIEIPNENNGLGIHVPNFGQNIIELIEWDRYENLKELAGYVGIKRDEYNTYEISDKETKNILYSINCGFDEFDITINDIKWVKDTNTSGKSLFTTNVISGAKPQFILQSMKYLDENGTIKYNFNINKTMGYISLLFAEIGVERQNEEFDIIINNYTRVENLNIRSITENAYYLNFRVPAKDKTIKLELKGYPIINGIQVSDLIKNDYEILPINYDTTIENKKSYLFVKKEIDRNDIREYLRRKNG